MAELFDSCLSCKKKEVRSLLANTIYCSGTGHYLAGGGGATIFGGGGIIFFQAFKGRVKIFFKPSGGGSYFF